MPELQLDGLLAPSHHFGALSFGNRASMSNRGVASNPRAAALQALDKMAFVMRLGVPQAVLPPLFRPDLNFLQQCGFTGSTEIILKTAAAQEPYLLSLAQSCSFTWTANCATCIPSADSEDGKCHLIAANLWSTPHRALEGQARADMLRHIFSKQPFLQVHDPLPMSRALADEGAANHHRFINSETDRGVHVFVHGDAYGIPKNLKAKKFPARQNKQAQFAVARLGQLRSGQSFYVTQNPKAIDAGAFHNDVVFAGDHQRLLLHESALIDQQACQAAFEAACPGLKLEVVGKRALSLEESVHCYLFNAQLVSNDQETVMIVPQQCEQSRPKRVLDRLLAHDFVDRVHYLDLSQSMQGGGGPACLRLRIPLTQDELSQIPQGIVLTEDKLASLKQWVEKHFRESLSTEDLADPQLFHETQTALDSLTQLLDIGSVYAFQS